MITIEKSGIKWAGLFDCTANSWHEMDFILKH